MADVLNDDVLSLENERVHLEKEIKEKNEFLKTQQMLFANEMSKIGDNIKNSLEQKKNESKIKKFFKRLLNVCK
jgi:predicted  nucleic acid-binding Zn-ribbon protein